MVLEFFFAAIFIFDFHLRFFRTDNSGVRPFVCNRSINETSQRWWRGNGRYFVTFAMLVIIFVLTPNLDMYPLKLPFEIAHVLAQLSRVAQYAQNSPHAHILYVFARSRAVFVFGFLMRTDVYFLKRKIRCVQYDDVV